MFKSQCLRWISDDYIKLDKYNQALKIIEMIENPPLKILSLGELDKKLKKNNQKLDRESLKLLAKMIKETK